SAWEASLGSSLRDVRLAFQHRLDFFEQPLGETRLGDERVAAGVHRALRVAGEGVAGQGDDGDDAGAVVGLEPPRGLPAVQARQREIHHDQEEHTSELQSLAYLVCRLLLEKKKTK